LRTDKQVQNRLDKPFVKVGAITLINCFSNYYSRIILNSIFFVNSEYGLLKRVDSPKQNMD